LRGGLSANQFVATIGSSRAGRVGQITRLYTEYLLRAPTAAEVTNWLHQYRGSSPRDRDIAMTLASSSEFQQMQRAATLLP
jgi:hypothetical protein